MLEPDPNTEPDDFVHPETLTALTQLMVCRRNKLVRSAQRITGNREEAEDVVQESALKALLNLHRFRGDSQIDTWLYSIVTNSAISRLRSGHRRCCISLETELQSTSGFLIHAMESPGSSPEQRCAEEELRTILHGEIEHLKPIYRSAIELCDIDEHSCSDAAKVLNLSVSMVKARLFRGRRLLRQKVCQQVFAQPAQAPCKSPAKRNGEPSKVAAYDSSTVKDEKVHASNI
jgi:RNA polymerase sigma-70 factor, ECF subfamily